MMNFNDIANIYFLGIGGIGMSALARYANNSGIEVAGYDLTSTQLTRKLEEEGIQIHYNDNADLIPKSFTPENTLVVVTPAVPLSLGEVQYLKGNGYQLLKRSQLLGELTNNENLIAVAGTHGKTSVSTMIAHLLAECEANVGAFLGGISKNFQSNLVLPKGKPEMVVTEADEFDRSFLQLQPSIAVITSIDADHLDIYGTHDEVYKAFHDFTEKVKPEGTLILKNTLDIEKLNTANKTIYTYGLSGEADFSVLKLAIDDGAYHFNIKTPWGQLKRCVLEYPGKVNVENMLAAVATIFVAGMNQKSKIRHAIKIYSGVERRFDVHVHSDKKIYIDDYAHHPEELKATISSIKELYSGKKILGIFQPHLYTRTRDFVDGFAKSLDLLDECILMDIYPAREIPIEGVTSKIILNKMKLSNKSIVTKGEIIDEIQKTECEVIVTLGAGNIDQLVKPITDILMK